MSRNKKFILILFIFLLIFALAASSLYLFFRRTQSEKITMPTNKNINITSGANLNLETNINAIANANLNVNILPETVLSEEQQVLSLARIFAERYGSFSNRNNFENILDLKNYMTSSLQKWADDFIVREKKEQQQTTDFYYGITSKVVSLELLELKDKRAKVELTIQRKETREETGSTNVFFQKLELTLNKDDIWKVDKIKWL